MEKISIIIPIYNSEEYISRCLDSILKQTYKDIEIICINDGSTDNSLELLKKYKKKDNRIQIIDKKNNGVSSARNDGIKKSTGKYITFVDADDWLEPNAIEILYNTLIDKKVDVVRGNYYINHTYDKNDISPKSFENIKNKKIFTKDKNFGELIIDKLLNGSIPCYIWLLLIKKEKMEHIYFKEDIKIMEDTIFYNELLKNIENIYFLDKPLYHYYYNQNSCTKSSEYYIRNMYNLIKVNKYLTEILTNSKFYSKERLEKMSASLVSTIMDYFYVIYGQSSKNKKIIINEINELLKNEELLKILDNINISYLPPHLRINIKLVTNKRYTILFIFYKIRHYISKIKN